MCFEKVVAKFVVLYIGHFLFRCFGNYLVKGGYKENTFLSGASKEPVIPEPEVFGAIFLDSDVLILLLYTRLVITIYIF